MQTELGRGVRRAIPRLFIPLLLLAAGQVAATPQPRHAQGFRWEQTPEGLMAHIATPDGRVRWRYLLVEDDVRSAAVEHKATVIGIPAQRVATLSTTHLPAVMALDMGERLVAHHGMRWVYSPAVRRLANEGGLQDVGRGGRLDIERLVWLRPDLVIAYPDFDGAALSALQRLDMTIVMNLEYLESTPLGRSEWVTFIGQILGAGEQSRALFSDIERRYIDLRERVEQAAIPEASRPTVLIGGMWGSIWPAAGGDSYVARLIADAGGRYVWRSNRAVGLLKLDFEAVYVQARAADIWIDTGIYRSLNALTDDEPRLRDFAAVGSGRVYNNDARRNEGGGVDYYESGTLRADLLLADLLHIFHPNLLPDHRLHYYRRLD